MLMPCAALYPAGAFAFRVIGARQANSFTSS